MATARRRNLIRSRRRVDDEGEDEDSGPVSLQLDSASDASNSSDADGDLDADDSDSSDVASTTNRSRNATLEGNPSRHTKIARKRKDSKAPGSGIRQSSAFKNTADTDAMINGFDLSNKPADAEELLFDEIPESAVPLQAVDVATPVNIETSTQAPRNPNGLDTVAQDTQQARNIRGPPLVPNRGGFFMHDQRNGTYQKGPGLMSRGRGRGRGQPTGYFEPTIGSGQDGRWDHDLHESLVNPKPVEASASSTTAFPRRDPMLKPDQQHHLSRSVTIGTVPLKVSLPNMQTPITFAKMPVKQHTRLPDLRPPLRRDKPVRVSLPDHTARYIFPSVERSFIFIPRAQRPNQQRGRLRGTRQSSQYGSRRTSIYGGSNYTPSVAMSRRSSQVRDGIISPAGSTMSRPPLGAPVGPARPIVKLPNGMRPYDAAGLPPNSYLTPMDPSQNWPSYPLPSRPAFRENRTGHIPMHQPRPQKAVSVATIESPAPKALQTPHQQEQQPFHNQVPPHMSVPDSSQGPPFEQAFPATSQFNNATKPSSFVNGPEQDGDAQPFQPAMMQQQAQYVPAYPIPNMVYYPAPEGQEGTYAPANGGMPPPYMPPHQAAGYMMPMFMPPPNMSEPVAVSPGQGNMSAFESNGMVYYYDPSTMASGNEGMPPPPSYTMPGMGGVMTPGPEGYFYAPPPQPMMYYPTQ